MSTRQLNIAATTAAACATLSIFAGAAASASITPEIVFVRTVGDAVNLVDTDLYAVGDAGYVALPTTQDVIASQRALRRWQAGSSQTLLTTSERITSLSVAGDGRVAYSSARLQAGSVAESFVRVASTAGVEPVRVASVLGSAGAFNNNLSVRALTPGNLIGVQRTNGPSLLYQAELDAVPTTVATGSTVESGAFNTIFGTYALDNANALFQARNASTGAVRVFEWNSLTTSLTARIDIADPATPVNSIDGIFAASGNGNIALIGNARTGGGERLLIDTSAGLFSPDLTADGQVLNNLGRVSINDSGLVLLTGTSAANGRTSIFSWQGGVQTQLLTVGDTLFGSTLAELDISTQALADDGRLAFYFRLTDGRSGIATAVIPTPSTALLLALAGITTAARRRR